MAAPAKHAQLVAPIFWIIDDEKDTHVFDRKIY